MGLVPFLPWKQDLLILRLEASFFKKKTLNFYYIAWVGEIKELKLGPVLVIAGILNLEYLKTNFRTTTIWHFPLYFKNGNL